MTYLGFEPGTFGLAVSIANHLHHLSRRCSMLHLTPALDTYMVFQGVVVYRLFLDSFLEYH
jgi:hypothetical protein